MTARYKYPIVDGNVALDMLSLSSNVAKVIAAGPTAIMLKNQRGYKKAPQALMNAMLELMNKVEQLHLEHGGKESKKQTFPHPTHHALELKKSTSEPKSEKVSSDVEYNPALTSGSEADKEDELGDATKRPKKGAKTSVGLNVAQQSAASSSSASKSTIHATTKKGKGFIKGQTLKPIDEKYVIGKSATLPFNDLENDSFLVKPRSYEPVI